MEEVEKEGPGASLPPLMLAHGAESALDYVCGVVTRCAPIDELCPVHISHQQVKVGRT